MSLHLDTNALIALLDRSGDVFQLVRTRSREEVLPACSAVAWHELVRGPLEAQELLAIDRVIAERVWPLLRSTAELGARLFNATGRRRASTADCLIAATALEQDAALVTANIEDFRVFEPYGLQLTPFNPD